MDCVNEVKLQIESRSVNEGYARVAVSAFAAALDPTVEELNDIKTAVSEAVTNCIVHAYPDTVGKIYITIKISSDAVMRITVRDRGCGIADVKQAREPLFTTLGGDRAGLGFSVMESFCDRVQVRSAPGRGTTVILHKRICGKGGGA